MKHAGISVKFLVTVSVLLLLISCIDVHDSFRSKRLVSGKGEEIYINTLKWGVTDDYQYTIISQDSTRLKERKDTIGGVGGLNPFIYKFSGDTLSLYFQKGNKMEPKETFETIKVNCFFLENGDYNDILVKAKTGREGYHNVPE